MGAALPPELSPTSASQFDSTKEASSSLPHCNGTSVNSSSSDVLQDPVSPSSKISQMNEKLNENSGERDTLASTKEAYISDEPLIEDQAEMASGKEALDSKLQATASNLCVDPVITNTKETIERDEKQGTVSISESFDELSSLSNGRSTPPERYNASVDGIPSVVEIDSDASGWGKVTGDGLLGLPPTVEQASSNFVATPVRKLHAFFMVRIPRPVDTNTKAEIKFSEMRLKEMTEKRDFLNAALQMKRASRQEVIERLKSAREKERSIREVLKEKRKEIVPLNAALNKIRETGRSSRDRGQDLCSSEKELDDRIASLESRIAHDTITLQEEKQIVREIRQLNASRDQVCANAVIHAEVQETVGQKDEIQARLKPLLAEVDALRRDHQIAGSKLAVIEDECNVFDEDISELVKQRDAANNIRQEAYISRQTLLKSENSRNDMFYETRREIQLAKQHASQNNKKAVEKLCNDQMERVLSLWTNDSNFRAEYVKNNEMSTMKRLETLDGRALGPDEEPPLLVNIHDSVAPMHNSRLGTESSQLANLNIANEKVKAQQVVNESKAPKTVRLSNEKLPKQNTVESEPSSVTRSLNGSEISAIPASYSQGNMEDNKAEELEAAQLKENIRQQEIAKAKIAEERKKKQAERSQARAVVRAQKEAERREKEREKKARKKAASATSAVASSEAMDNQAEITVEEKVETVEASVDKASPPSRGNISSQRRKKLTVQRHRSSKDIVSNLSMKKAVWPFQIWFLIAAVITLLLIGILSFYLWSS